MATAFKRAVRQTRNMLKGYGTLPRAKGRRGLARLTPFKGPGFRKSSAQKARDRQWEDAGGY